MSIYKIERKEIRTNACPYKMVDLFFPMVYESKPKRFLQFSKPEKVWNYLPVEDVNDTPTSHLPILNPTDYLHFLTLQEAEEFIKHCSDVEIYRTYLKDVKGRVVTDIEINAYQFQFKNNRYGNATPYYPIDTPYTIRRCFGYNKYGYKLLYVETTKNFFGFEFCWKVVQTLNDKFPILGDKIFTSENEAIEFINSNGKIEPYNMNLQELLQQKKEINHQLNLKHTTLYVDGVKQKNIVID